MALTSVGEGNLPAAILTERALATFRPAAALFTGTAGSLRPAVRLGDVVVATRVYSLHGGRAEPDGLRLRPRCWDAPHALLQVADHLASLDTWAWQPRHSIVAHSPVTNFAPIVAGEVVLNACDSATARYIANFYNDAVAIETESAGFAAAAWLNQYVPALTIRGISDHAGGDKDRTDRDGWRDVAIASSAAFTVLVARRIGLEDRLRSF